MQSALKLEIKEPSEIAENRSFLAGTFVVGALVAALFCGAVGPLRFEPVIRSSLLAAGEAPSSFVVEKLF
jgi:hypothetical protein